MAKIELGTVFALNMIEELLVEGFQVVCAGEDA
jgi:hypothetical protein